MTRLIALAALAVLVAAGGASATVVTAIPDGTIIPMPLVNYFGPGPQTFGIPAVTWSSTNAALYGGSVFGYDLGYTFAGNGGWDAAIGPMAGLNDSVATNGVSDTMTFSFSTPVHAVGGFVNYVPGFEPGRLAVYDSRQTLMESYDLSFLTGGGTNTGAFYGFAEKTPIAYFELSDAFVGITALTVQIPEPPTLVVMCLGLAGIRLLQSHRRHRG